MAIPLIADPLSRLSIFMIQDNGWLGSDRTTLPGITRRP
jgi:hypothetical protein